MMARGFRDEGRHWPQHGQEQTERSDLVDIAVTLVHQTELAWLVDNGERQAWVPKSRGEFSGGILTLPERLATEKRLI